MTSPARLRLAEASIRIDLMPSEGRDVHLAAAAEERAALAEHLEITSVERLEVRLHAVRFKGGIRVTGRLEAEIVQPSVVSLEPVSQSIAEPIDRVFLPGGQKEYAEPAGAEIFVDLEGADVPDHFEGAEADLSDLIVETLSLAIDPYPRAAGETVADLGVAADEEAPDSPFAALGRLKDKGGKGS
jgi:uncharacterized metal-binding protein YceD (DUF177 family)